MVDLPERLLPWYVANRRSLPWRDHPDPYAVWVSEVMLQQTRAATVQPYFERWMVRFPDIESLARAEQQDVLTLWEGLGYYSRARNLHRAAGIVSREYGGRLPADPTALRALPGIGPYTAGAIASLAFNLDEALVDGNVRRVLARVFNLEIAADSSAGKKMLWGIAAEQLPAGRARDFNQALMELGALVCVPRNPACPTCPVREVCRAYKLGTQSERPVMKPKKTAPHYTVAAAVIRRDERFLIARRPEEGLLGGMWEFPGGKQETGEDLPACLRREIGEELGVTIRIGESIGVYRHAYSHFRITLHAFDCSLAPENQPLQEKGVSAVRWVKSGELAGYPMGKIDRQIADRIANTSG